MSKEALPGQREAPGGARPPASEHRAWRGGLYLESLHCTLGAALRGGGANPRLRTGGGLRLCFVGRGALPGRPIAGSTAVDCPSRAAGVTSDGGKGREGSSKSGTRAPSAGSVKGVIGVAAVIRLSESLLL